MFSVTEAFLFWNKFGAAFVALCAACTCRNSVTSGLLIRNVLWISNQVTHDCNAPLMRFSKQVLRSVSNMSASCTSLKEGRAILALFGVSDMLISLRDPFVREHQSETSNNLYVVISPFR